MFCDRERTDTVPTVLRNSLYNMRVIVIMLNSISVKIIANILPAIMMCLPMEIYYSFLYWRSLSVVHVEEHIQTSTKISLIIYYSMGKLKALSFM